jgi:hypothetical protein
MTKAKQQATRRNPFAPWEADQSKVSLLRDRVLIAATEARKGKLGGVARAFLEHYIKVFNKKSRRVRKRRIAARSFRGDRSRFLYQWLCGGSAVPKEVPIVHMRDLAAGAREQRAKKPSPQKVTDKLNAVRGAMKASNIEPTRGIKYARQIQPEVQRLLGQQISDDSVRGYVRKILDEKNLG